MPLPGIETSDSVAAAEVSGAETEHAPLLLPSSSAADDGEHELRDVAPTDRGCVDRWLTPQKVLVVFSLLNFVTYFDRGAMAGCLTAIKTDASIRGSDNAVSDTRIGLIASSFMVGYMCTCPLFAALGAWLRAKHIILLGMVVWSAACLSTAASTGYRMLLASRLLVGVGEAAYVGFTVTIIDNIAPPSRRTSWIGVFYSMIPVGTAIGIAVGGLLSNHSSFFGTPLLPWRALFLGEVAVAVPILFAIAALPHRLDCDGGGGGDADVEGDEGPVEEEAEYLPLHKATALLAKNASYLLIVGGFAMYCFVVGAISVWAVPFLAQGPLRLPTAKAAILIGLSTSVCGIVGSLFGGWVVDRLGGSKGKRGSAKCQLFSAAMIAVSVPCGATALLQTDIVPFTAAFLLSVLALFSVTAPINASILTVVPHSLRPYAVSYSVFLIHFFGDFPSPTFAGMLSDRFSRGCASFRSSEACRAAPVQEGGLFRSRACVWVSETASTTTGGPPPPPPQLWWMVGKGVAGRVGGCVNTYQLRDALLVVFSFLAIAIPCWMAVFVRARREAHEEERISDVVVVHTNHHPQVSDEAG